METTLGVGEATRAGQSCCFKRRPLGAEPCRRETTLGACIESYTDVGGVFVRLGYTVLARESGRGGEDAERAADLVA